MYYKTIECTIRLHKKKNVAEENITLGKECG